MSDRDRMVEIIVGSDDYITARKKVILDTVRVFEDMVKKHPNATCNQSLYIKDVKFLLGEDTR